ncbi:hypothetical protein [Rugosimonospora africana]|nr:hypothetical protein [Rugosimonospora africana]
MTSPIVETPGPGQFDARAPAQEAYLPPTVAYLRALLETGTGS